MMGDFFKNAWQQWQDLKNKQNASAEPMPQKSEPSKPEPDLNKVAPVPLKTAVKTCPRTPAEYAAKYAAAIVKPDKLDYCKAKAKLLESYRKNFYEPVAQAVGCPWWVVACIHLQECGEDVGVFKAVLHNGEKIVGTGKKTKLVPKGKGPFTTWELAAIDALGGKNALVKKSWDVGSALQFLEVFNGLGYRAHGISSPYLWSYTDQYSKGKYVADGVWSATAVSKQQGCAAIMKCLGIV
jgi:lysozyme family protein